MENPPTNGGLGPAGAQSGTAPEGSSSSTNAPSGSQIATEHPEQELKRLRKECGDRRTAQAALEQQLQGNAALVDKLRAQILNDRVQGTIRRLGTDEDPKAVNLLGAMALQQVQPAWGEDGVTLTGDLEAAVRGVLEPLGKLKPADPAQPAAATGQAPATTQTAALPAQPAASGAGAAPPVTPTAPPPVFPHMAQRPVTTTGQQTGPADDAEFLAGALAKHGFLR